MNLEEHPDPRRLTWPAIIGILTTGAALGWAAATITLTIGAL